jgi:uncharacterized membrane protein YphA (DoxX/SURF4 family)
MTYGLSLTGRATMAQKVTRSQKLQSFLFSYGAPLVDLGLRLYVASRLYPSGWDKLRNLFDKQWEATVLLFQYIHPFPYLPAPIAAFTITTSELVFSIFIVLGFLGRFSAFMLLLVVLGFYLVTPVPENLVLALMLGVIITRGVGAFSVDALIQYFKESIPDRPSISQP